MSMDMENVGREMRLFAGGLGLLRMLGHLRVLGLFSVLGVLGLQGCATQPGAAVPVEDRNSGATLAPLMTMPVVISTTKPIAAPMESSRTMLPRIEQQAAPVVVPRSAAPVLATGGYAGPSPVLLALMEQADGLESRGDRQGALAQLERAQRIAPRDPMVYLQLARLRLHMHDHVRAEQLARRGLSLAHGDQDLALAFEAILIELQRR